ncbi:Germin [Parasponia andersonii]|uniref:Germin-like protein n=1 Tax=Parasponia andersonii TaxID=3476 RepID=A0A2P5CJ75_PARAD|nr:Germin [Parasponia andersonii]
MRFKSTKFSKVTNKQNGPGQTDRPTAPRCGPRVDSTQPSLEWAAGCKGKLLVGFVTTNNVLYAKVLTAGQMFVIPRGLVHFLLNVGEEKSLTFTAFNGHLPNLLFATSYNTPNSKSSVD